MGFKLQPYLAGVLLEAVPLLCHALILTQAAAHLLKPLPSSPPAGA